MMAALLEIQGVSKTFGGLAALTDVTLSMQRGEILGVVGPNGAGKSVLINLLTGFYPPSGGRMSFDGQDVTSLSRLEKSRRGLARTFQNIRLFKRMTVLENVLVAQRRNAWHPFRSVFRPARSIEQAIALLDLLRLTPMADQMAGALPYGAARRLEIARALATEPRLLLLDEPAAGMNEEETAALVEDIGKALQRVQGILLVEHDMSLIRALSSRLVALIAGRKIADGPVADVLSHADVIDAYLGSPEELA
jgi:branched-chain amino acid transport system ATP-binding protein